MSVKLDLKDKKIIYELDVDSRQSASQLAKKVGVSKQGCTFKINNLVKKGIINSFVTVLNTPLMGHLSFRMYFKLIDISPSKETEFRNWLINHNLIPWVVGCEGLWDYIIVVFPKDFTEFESFSTELNNNWGNFVEKKDIALVTEAHHFRSGYLLEKKVDIPPLTYAGQPKEVYKLDEIENKILAMLCENSRAELVQIGKQLNLPSKTVAYRIKKLREINLIEGYTLTVDYSKLGFERYKVFIRSKSMDQEREKSFIEWARMHPYCLYYSKSIASSDVELELIVKNSIHLREIVAEIRKNFNDVIRAYEVMKIYQEFKLNFIPWVNP
ncbi:Lrp/AsnC family transcriptional regulator [Candidatus Woesearchaeota archaeon]|nr:Lrp/AsnC family transcriptional regulator [Candidatus Woesearchaeota archaeon]